MLNFRTFDEVNKILLECPEEAAAYIDVALEEFAESGDTQTFLRALRDVSDAQGGMTQMAHTINRSRQSLYKTLSAKGNPRLDTFTAVLNALGLKMMIVQKQPRTATPVKTP